MACSCFGKKKKTGDLDSYIGSDKVVGLAGSKFYDFVENKELALIMFYHPMLDCDPVKKQFKKAAHITKRKDLGFGAVNCQQEEDLCCNEEVRCMPYFKLYSLGQTISSVDEAEKLKADAIKLWLESVVGINGISGKPQ